VITRIEHKRDNLKLLIEIKYLCSFTVLFLIGVLIVLVNLPGLT